MKLGRGWAPESTYRENDNDASERVRNNNEFSDLATSELKILLKRIFEAPKTHYLRCKQK